MPNVTNHNDPKIYVSEVKVFRQEYYVVDDLDETGGRTDYPLREARVEVMADEDGVFLECREGSVTEALSIPTPDLAVSVANYILRAYDTKDVKNAPEESLSFQSVKVLSEDTQKRVAHELWRLSNHISSPHGPVDQQGAPELMRHIATICALLDLKPKPYTP